MPKIGLIGFGHWGSRVAEIILRQGFNVDTIFTSKNAIFNSINYHRILPINEISVDSIGLLTHLFILTGPPYHHDVINRLVEQYSIDNLPFLWLEKPFYTEKNTAKLNDLIYRKIYIDYPYSPENADDSFRQIVNRYSSDSIIEINLFSKYDKERKFGVVFDFLPHIVSLMSFFVSDLDSLKYSNWRIENISVQCPESGVRREAKVYAFIAISDSDDIRFLIKFGIANSHISCLKFAKQTDCLIEQGLLCHDHLSSFSVNLGDIFSSPVDKNVMRFLSSSSSEPISFFGPHFHETVFRISHKARFEFDKVEYC